MLVHALIVLNVNTFLVLKKVHSKMARTLKILSIINWFLSTVVCDKDDLSTYYKINIQATMLIEYLS